MKRYLLLGGTGAMGVYLVDELLAEGAEVYVTTRSARESTERLHYLQGDAHDRFFLKDVLAQVKPDVVVDFMVYSTHEFLDRYKMFLEGTGHYLFLSSYRVFAGSHPLTEDSPRLLDASTDKVYLQTDEYGVSKARQENILRDARKNNWTILRPSITYSRNRFQFGCLEAGLLCFRSLQGLPVMMPGEMLDKRATMTWARDVARMIAKLAQNSQAMGEDFNVVTAESHTWREIADIYRQTIGMQVKEVSLDDYLSYCAEYQTRYDRMFDREMNNEKVLRVTGLKQADLTPLAVGLTRELEAFKANPRYQYGFDLGGSATLDRLCGTRTRLSGCSLHQRLVYYRCRYGWLERMARVAKSIKR